MKLHEKIIHHSKKFFARAKEKIEETPPKKNLSHFFFPQLLKEKKQENIVHTSIYLFSAIKIIAVVFGVLLLAALLGQIANIILSFFLALFLSASLFPGVHALEKKNIPSGIAIALVMVSVLGVFIFLIANLLPALIDSAKDFLEWGYKILEQVYLGNFNTLPSFLQQFGRYIQDGLFSLEEYLKSVQSDSDAQKGLLDMVGNNIIVWKDIILGVFGGIVSFLSSLMIILILSFFILIDRENLKSFFLGFFSPKTQGYVSQKTEQMQVKITQWIHGQMILFLFMGGATWIFLSLLGVEYALTLGFLTGIAEFIPYLGPFLAFVISTPIAFSTSPEVGIAVIIFFFILQMVEGNILVPMVMKKTVGVPPLVTILAMLIGFQFLNVVGAIIAIPVASIITLFVMDLRQKEHEIFEKEEERETEEQEIEKELEEEFEKFEEWEEKKMEKLENITEK